MKWNNLTDAEKSRLARLYQANDLNEETNTSGVPLGKLIRNIRDYLGMQELYSMSDAIEASQAMPDSPTRIYNDYETVEWDDAVIISDIEVPDHSPAYLLAALYVGMRYGIKKLVVNGDFIATDQDGLNSWANIHLDDSEVNYERAIGLNRNIIAQFGRQYDEQVILEGNHDNRIARATKGQVHFGMFLNGTGARYSRYPYMYIKTSRGYIKAVHPQTYRSNPITIGLDMYNGDVLSPDIVIGHCHLHQSAVTADGLHIVHTLGCGRDPKRTKYQAHGATTFKQWNRSFVMVRHGFITPVDLQFTDMEELLGPDLYPLYEKRLLREDK